MFRFFIFKQKTAYELRISDWSSDVCSSDLAQRRVPCGDQRHVAPPVAGFDDDLCEAGYRRPAFDRKTMAGSGRGTMPLAHELDRYLSVRRRARKDGVSGKRVSVRVDHGGSCLLTKKTLKSKILPVPN